MADKSVCVTAASLFDKTKPPPPRAPPPLRLCPTSSYRRDFHELSGSFTLNTVKEEPDGTLGGEGGTAGTVRERMKGKVTAVRLRSKAPS